MENRKNPFHEIYVTESIGSERFVKLFSPFLVDQALALFEPGHVVLKGLPGSGKSMLLSLLKPSIRIAYHENNVDFPVPKHLCKFIGAGINLIRSSVSDFGQRPVNDKGGFEESPFYFADYLNYWIVLDILDSMKELGEKEGLCDEIGIDLSVSRLDSFAKDLTNDACWNGYLSGVKNYFELVSLLDKRIRIYRDFLNYNLEKLPADVKSTKTVVGFPITVVANLLRRHGIISKETEIFIRIDQYEELAWLEDMPDHPEKAYQQMIHKLLAMRDTSVSYRLGTRHFAWDETLSIFGTSARLEKGRNYIDISIDAILKRKENQKTWIFPEFAEDILLRRIELSGLNFKEGDSVLTQVFGRSEFPKEMAKRYVKSNLTKAVKLEESWPEEWKLFLLELAKKDPFSARLGEAWVRQKRKYKKEVMYSIPENDVYPWDKQWWKKERVGQALLQIASRNNQQLIWFGKDNIISLCGSNILAFLKICRSIWDVWIRDTQSNEEPNRLVTFDPETQSIGVIEASNSWYNDMAKEKGGKYRQAFVRYLGTYLFKTLVEDISMSNPGHNGFSLDVEELEKAVRLKKFLNEATDYGDLYDAPHTSKLKDKRERKKYYLNPILSPRFKVPSSHTKEPIYTNTKEVLGWVDICIDDSNSVAIKKKNGGSSSPSQTTLNF